MISPKVLGDAIFQTIKRSSCDISPDVHGAFEKAIHREESPVARRSLEKTLQSLNLSRERECLACPDTGWPLFFFKVGNEARIEGGFMTLEEISRLDLAYAPPFSPVWDPLLIAANLLKRKVVRPSPKG